MNFARRMRPFRQVDCRSWFSYAMDLLLHTDGANALTVAAAGAAIAETVRTEQQVASVVAAVRIERTRPIATVTTCIVRIRVIAITGSRQENTIAIALAGFLCAVYAIQSCP